MKLKLFGLPWFSFSSLVFSAIAFLLSACTVVGPNFNTPQTDVQSHWIESKQSLPQLSDQMSANAFWASFQDETLVKLIAEANAHNLSLQSAAENVVQALQILRVDTGGDRPSVNLSASSVYSRPSLASSIKKQNDGLTTDQLLGQGTWEIDFWGKWKRTLEADRAALASSHAALASARVSLEASVASVYCNVRVLERRLIVAQADLKEQAENMRIAEARFRLGANSELDLRQAQTQYEQTSAQLPALRTTLEQYQHALSILVGQTPDYFARTMTAKGSLPALPKTLPLGAPNDLLRRRPDVQQAEYAAAAQSARIGQAQAALYPTFSLSGSVGFSTTSGVDSLFKWDSRALSFGGGLYLPIFDRGRIKAQVEVQDSIFRQALLNYQNQVLKAQQDVEDALSAIRGGTIEVANLERAEKAAARSVVLAQKQYLSGQTDYTTVSTIDQAHLQTSTTLVQTQGNLLQAYISAFRALGGGWQPDSVVEATASPINKRDN